MYILNLKTMQNNFSNFCLKEEGNFDIKKFYIFFVFMLKFLYNMAQL